MKQRQVRSLKEGSNGYVAAFIDYHSYAEAMLPPWAYTAKAPEGPDGVYQSLVSKKKP